MTILGGVSILANSGACWCARMYNVSKIEMIIWCRVDLYFESSGDGRRASKTFLDHFEKNVLVKNKGFIKILQTNFCFNFQIVVDLTFPYKQST